MAHLGPSRPGSWLSPLLYLLWLFDPLSALQSERLLNSSATTLGTFTGHSCFWDLPWSCCLNDLPCFISLHSTHPHLTLAYLLVFVCFLLLQTSFCKDSSLVSALSPAWRPIAERERTVNRYLPQGWMEGHRLCLETDHWNWNLRLCQDTLISFPYSGMFSRALLGSGL